MEKIVNSSLLITGGTGSFGNAVLKRFLTTDHFSEIRIFSRDENGVGKMNHFLKCMQEICCLDQGKVYQVRATQG